MTREGRDHVIAQTQDQPGNRGHNRRTTQMIAAHAQQRDRSAWFARAVVTAVLALNLECALAFVLRPERYVGGFELAGLPGEAAVRGLGIAFVMWNVTYPLVIWQPRKHRAVFAIVLVQQTVGLVGETWLLLTLPAGHETLASTITRFIAFDGAGLALMALAFVLLGRRASTKLASGDATSPLRE